MLNPVIKYIVTIEAKRATITDSNIGEYPKIIPGRKNLYINKITNKRAIIALKPLNLASNKTINTNIPVKYKTVYNDFTWELIKKYKIPPSSRGKKIKVHLEERVEKTEVNSESFFITIYDYKEMYDYCKLNNLFSIKLVSQDPNLIGDINIVLDEK